MLANAMAERFRSGLESFRFPLRMSENGSEPPHMVSISKLCSLLDRWISGGDDRAETDWGRSAPTSGNTTLEEDALSHAIYAFSARWLYLYYPGSGQRPTDSWYEELAEKYWRNARQDMLRVVNITTYCSVLAMFLFGLTPTPCGIPEEEEMNGLSGHVCLQLALQKLQTLRTRTRTCQFTLSGAFTNQSSTPSRTGADLLAHQAYLDAESCAYWTGLVLDTATSLTLDHRPTLSAGLLGFEAESSFELIRKRSLLFQVETEPWLRDGIELTDDIALTIIVALGAWKLYTWKNISVLKEALRDGHDDAKVVHAFRGVSDAIRHFKTVYRPLLDVCEQRLQFLSWRPRFEWCKHINLLFSHFENKDQKQQRRHG